MQTAILTNDYRCSIAAKTSAKEAFEKICDVSGWWTTDFEGNARKADDIFIVTFGETFATFKIEEAVPYKKIVWYVMDCNLHWLKDKKEWEGTRVIWEITAGDHSTKIEMTHQGLVPEVECYTNCESGWNRYIKESLFKLLTENKGMPVIAGSSAGSSDKRSA